MRTRRNNSAVDVSAIRLALLGMGYTEIKPNNWVKPVGYQLFVYREAHNSWENWCRTLKGESVWESHSFSRPGLQYLDQLKQFECFTRTDVYVDGSSQFELPAFDL